ncbi:MAG: tRNA (guanosine(37)-N1)-methyltransferase TrmD [Clostridiales bacterium]|nr:tRNA (guanosine(37)-N1)-methyltransferase TrmD [Clostridiales bacterium]
MKIDILTLFPEMFTGVLSASILGRAAAADLLTVETHNIRDYSTDKHRKADDYPFGGGAGLVMMAQPIFDCMAAMTGEGPAHRVLLTPRGAPLCPDIAKRLANEEHLVLLCGHYEGVDERVMTIIDEEVSIGDYVLTGGELPAMVLVDCLARFVPGVLGGEMSTEEESFVNDLLEYPQYTRPADFRGLQVPEILLSGHHANIQAWRRSQAEEKTRQIRPDLLYK